MRHAQRVIAYMDDALIIRDRHPVLFARAAQRGEDCWWLSNAYNAWLSNWCLDSWTGGFNVTQQTASRTKRRRRKEAHAKAARKRNRS